MIEDPANDLINKGLEAEKAGNYDKGSEYYRQALSIYRQEIRRYGKVVLINQIARNKVAFERSVMLLGWLRDYVALFDLSNEIEQANLPTPYKKNLLGRMKTMIGNEAGKISFHAERGER